MALWKISHRAALRIVYPKQHQQLTPTILIPSCTRQLQVQLKHHNIALLCTTTYSTKVPIMLGKKIVDGKYRLGIMSIQWLRCKARTTLRWTCSHLRVRHKIWWRREIKLNMRIHTIELMRPVCSQLIREPLWGIWKSKIQVEWALVPALPRISLSSRRLERQRTTYCWVARTVIVVARSNHRRYPLSRQKYTRLHSGWQSVRAQVPQPPSITLVILILKCLRY